MEKIITDDSNLKGALPAGFLWGTASASYQIEGGWNEDGKGPNVYDELMKNMENGEVACDSYHLWKEDVALLKQYGVDVYRFSISWPRVIPLGGADDPVNEKGIEYYSNLIDALIAEGITPAVTIYHWDLPLALYKKYDGLYSSEAFARDFVRYADLLFERFGDRVKFWITINEPHIITALAGFTYPGKWNPLTDIPIFAESLLICHGRTVDLYRRKYQAQQKGRIGITLNADWAEPIDDSAAAKEMRQLYLDHNVGLYADPIFHGRFPQSILDDYGDIAPKLSDNDWKLLKGSSDFFGLNTYGTSWITGKRFPPGEGGFIETVTGRVERVFEKDGKLIGNKGLNGHPHDVPWGFRKLLQYLHKTYTKDAEVPIFITENGFPVVGESEMSLEERINDTQRQHYYAGYLRELILAVKEDKIDVGGYMAWSLMDNLEWMMGYAPRFGITIIDNENGFKRIPKESAHMLGRIFSFAKAK